MPAIPHTAAGLILLGIAAATIVHLLASRAADRERARAAACDREREREIRGQRSLSEGQLLNLHRELTK